MTASFVVIQRSAGLMLNTFSKSLTVTLPINGSVTRKSTAMLTGMLVVMKLTNVGIVS